MKRSMLSSVLLIAVCSLAPFAAGAQAQMTFSVDVDVDCDDLEIRSLARGFFSRELRELGDVSVGEAGVADFLVDAIIIKSGVHDWWMSAVISAPLHEGSVPGLDPKMAASLADYAKAIDHSLTRGDDPDDLGREIIAIVKSLDTEVLKPLRKEMKKKK